AKSPVFRWTFRAPVIPETSAMKSGWIGKKRSQSGTRWLRRDGNLICTRRACWRSMWRELKRACGCSLGVTPARGGAQIRSQKFSPYELGFAKMVHLDKENFVGRAALAKANKEGVPRQLVGLELDWNEIDALYDRLGLTPAAPSQASRVHVPVYSGNRQIGK